MRGIKKNPDMTNQNISDVNCCEKYQRTYRGSSRSPIFIPYGQGAIVPMTDQGQVTQPKIDTDKETLRLTYPL